MAETRAPPNPLTHKAVPKHTCKCLSVNNSTTTSIGLRISIIKHEFQGWLVHFVNVPCDPLQRIIFSLIALSRLKNKRYVKLMQPGQKLWKAAKDHCMQVKEVICLCKLQCELYLHTACSCQLQDLMCIQSIAEIHLLAYPHYWGFHTVSTSPSRWSDPAYCSCTSWDGQ